VISAEVVIAGGRACCVDGLSSGFLCAEGRVESALDKTFRAESGRIAGTHFLSALRAVWHLDQSRSSYFTSFAPEASNLEPAIPYSWQVSRFELAA
jgi:hypothetical protein